MNDVRAQQYIAGRRRYSQSSKPKELTM